MSQVPDLLEPVLTEAHDATEFHKPWNPALFPYLAFFFGAPASGILLFLNAHRLGLKRAHAWSALAVSLLFVLIWHPAAMQGVEYFARAGVESKTSIEKVFAEMMIEDREKEYAQYARWTAKALAVLILWPFVRAQRRRFRLAEFQSARPGNLLLPAIITSILSLVLDFVVAWAAHSWRG